MSESSIVAIILGILTFAGGFFATLAGRRKDALNSALEFIEKLKDDNQKHDVRIQSLENQIDDERSKRRKMETDLDDEKIARRTVERDLLITRKALEQKTQSAGDRQERILELEELTKVQAERIEELEKRLIKVEKKTGPLGSGKGAK